MNPILALSAVELATAIAHGETSAVEATQAYLDAIGAHDPQVQAYNETYGESALDRAKSIDIALAAGETPGPLAGVPIAIKDNLCTTFGHTTCASKYLKDFRAPYTATAIERLEQAGAVILGKANMDEFAMGSSTENSSTHVTRNPWNLDCVPGGSSGGSAAAVAAKLCAAALGSDTGGSIRQPAAFCGVVGFKPTYGRVSRFGLVAFGSSLDQIGPLTTTVADAALLTGIIAGADRHDATSLPDDVPDYLAELETPIEGLRIGLPKEFLGEDNQAAGALAPEMRRAVEKAAETYRALGAEIVEVSLPHSRIDSDEAGQLSSFAVAAYYIICTAEASSNLSRFDSVHYGYRTAEKVDDIITMYMKSRAESLGQEVKRRIMLGNYALSSGYYDAYYNKALKVRRLIANDFHNAFESCDMLLTPTTPTAAFPLGEKTDDPMEMYLADLYTISVNLAGLPAIALPAGLSQANKPLGIQLIGPALSEAPLLRAARMYEAATPKMPQPPLTR